MKTTNGVYVADVELDADGLRMKGLCRLKVGKSASFTATSTQRLCFAPFTTDELHIEPLPNYIKDSITAQSS